MEKVVLFCIGLFFAICVHAQESLVLQAFTSTMAKSELKYLRLL
ncbi:MAG: hypothetical protein ACI89U_003190, partial [Gammaproteobacteria bacterium]